MIDNITLFRSFKLRPFYFLLLVLTFSGCATSPTSNNTYGTTVTAKGNEVNLALSSDYPYISKLNSGLKIRASYHVKGVKVSEVISSTRFLGLNANFSIPNTLSGVPDNQVCLQIEPLVPIQTKYGSVNIIPVRRVSEGSNANAVAFRYPEWELNLKNLTKLKVTENELFRLETLLDKNEKLITMKKSIEDCDSLNLKTLNYDEPEIQDKVKFDEESKKVCIWRAQSFVEYFGQNGSEKADTFIAKFDMNNLSENLSAKGELLQKDWKFYSPIVRKLSDKTKTFGRPMRINENLLISNFKYKNDIEKMTKNEILSDLINILGQYTDLYDTCKRDVNIQLEGKLNAWKQRMEKQAIEDDEYLRYAISECKLNFSKEQKNTEIRNNLTNTIEKKKDEIKMLKSEVHNGSSGKNIQLNTLTCTY